MIKSCTCISPFQDKLYGKGMRVKNICKKGSAIRCTICGKEENYSTKVEKVKAKAEEKSEKKEKK